MDRTKLLTSFLVFLVIINPLFANDDNLLQPLRIDIPPIIDGRLDEDIWQRAPFVTGFKTFVPDFGIDMADKTFAYMAYDDENLYFGFRCFDSEPDKIKSSISRRDNIRADDWICINLDSFNDQQALYAFYINPAGIQSDTRYAGGTEDPGVDLVWYSGGNLDDQGYTIEVQIPFKSIRFANKNPVEMGVIFERKVSRRAEQGTFPPLNPDRGFFFLTQMKPMVFHNIKHYTLFEVLPAVTFGHRKSIDEGDLSQVDQNEDISLTSKLGISSDLILDATYNPDFSQVEADAGQIDENVRFALFFPEKRPFFLEGRENFNFSGSSSSDPLQAIVHTRQIVDPTIGVKLSGKIGRNNTIASIYALDDLSGLGNQDEKDAHFAIMRYKRKLSEDSYLGAVMTGRERKNGYNRVFGTDGLLRINQSSVFGYHLMTSRNKADSQSDNESGHAIGLDYEYQIRKWRMTAGVHDLSDNFQTETGYVTRTGISKIRASFGPKFYPHAKVVRRIDPTFSTEQTKDKPSDQYETSNTMSLRFVMQRSSSMNWSYNHSTEIFLGEKFDTNNLRVTGNSQFTKELYFSLSYRNGKSIRYIADPFQGKGQSASGSITFQPSDKLNANLSLSYTDLKRESNSEKIFDFTIIRNLMIYQMNQYLFFRSILEYNTFRKTLLTDFLASFTYIPGTVIHFGYGAQYEKIRWQNDQYVDSDSFLETRRGFFAKASYLWRL